MVSGLNGFFKACLGITPLLVLLICPSWSEAQEISFVNTYNRPSTSLNGYWKYIIDPYENGYYNYRLEAFDQQEEPGKNAFFTNAKPSSPSELVEYDFDRSDSLLVPGDWNTQKEKLLYYEGTVWYRKMFDYTKRESSNRVFVSLGAANYKAEVYLNGKKLGTHVGGFTPFVFEITELLRPAQNFLVIKVDNKRLKDGIPTLNTDWWNYGGLTREVKLIETSDTFIADYFLQLDPLNPKILKGYVQLRGANASAQNVDLSIPELSLNASLTPDEKGLARISLPVEKLSPWSVDSPKLYQVQLSSGDDSITDMIGFRTMATQGDRILLNDKPIFLKGISIHEESPTRGGRAHSPEDAEQLLLWAKELGCNFVRLAHYPHNEDMVRLADQMGILVWEENPVYWTISWENPDTYDNAARQLTELISRDKNRASVIIWSMANETPTSAERTLFLTKLASLARSLDPTRLISAALEQSTYQDDPNIRTIDDDFAQVVDVLSFNQYIGWYDGLPEKAGKISWVIEQDKPVLISEFGGGAKQGFHGEKTTRWTEEYQEYLYEETLKMLSSIDQLQGMSPWILVDFRSPRRVLPQIQDGWNRKGLISEKGVKKKAFFVLQKYYNTKE